MNAAQVWADHVEACAGCREKLDVVERLHAKNLLAVEQEFEDFKAKHPDWWGSGGWDR